MADYFTLLTDTGRFKIASATANNATVSITHFAVGDGNGQSVNPIPSQTALVNEVWRTQVESVEIDPNNPAAVIIKAIIPHDAGGWWMREIGIFDHDNDLIAVVKCQPEFKPTAAQGQIEDILYEFQLVIGEQANVVLLVNPSIMWATREYVESRFVPMRQMMNTPWLPVKAMNVTEPPENAAMGNTYLVPAGSTGDWGGKAGQLAEWNGVSWNFISSKDGHGIGLPEGQVFIRVAGQYQPLGQGLPGQRDNWRAVKSMTVTTPPTGAQTGDAYLIPSGATGVWAGKSGQIAIRDEDKWVFITSQDGHGLGLPDGRLFIRHGGGYREKIAHDVQSGKWLYAEAGGEPNALTATLTPPPAALVDGMKIRLKPGSTNSGPVTLDINGLGAQDIVDFDGEPLAGGELRAETIIELIYNSNVGFMIASPIRASSFDYNCAYFTTPGAITWQVPKGVTLIEVEIWGGGGGSAGGENSNATGSGGGGSGAYARKRMKVQPQQILNGVVGGGGAAGNVYGGAGGTGGTTSFAGVMSATGGGGGEKTVQMIPGHYAYGRGGAGGIASGGDINAHGSKGGSGEKSNLGGAGVMGATAPFGSGGGGNGGLNSIGGSPGGGAGGNDNLGNMAGPATAVVMGQSTLNGDGNDRKLRTSG